MNHDILDPVISIGTLANKVGLSVSAIRKYEEEGLIIPHRSESGHRMFSYEDINRIQTIQHMDHLIFQLIIWPIVLNNKLRQYINI